MRSRYTTISTMMKLRSSATLAEPQRRDEAADEHDRRVGDRVDDLEHDQHRASRRPGAGEHLHPVHDQADEQQPDEDAEDEVR